MLNMTEFLRDGETTLYTGAGCTLAEAHKIAREFSAHLSVLGQKHIYSVEKTGKPAPGWAIKFERQS